MRTFRILFILPLIFVAIASCKRNSLPRPEGYFRITIPEHNYELFKTSEAPFSFEKSKAAHIIEIPVNTDTLYWCNIAYKGYRAILHLSYNKLEKNLYNVSEDARKLVYKHTVKADAITETPFRIDSNNVAGIVYDLGGNAASPLQFIATDSSRNFLRGALYFNNTPNRDSLAPVIEYIRADILILLQTLKWE